MCGEQQRHDAIGEVKPGSPPRVRGTAAAYADAAQPVGITPACAGNRGRLEALYEKTEDHPRVCGEQVLFWPPARLLKGSPPRVRGTADIKGERTLDVRITPACAGNSKPQ